MKDYYAILEVDTSSSEREIKQAYRKLAKKYHPDRNPDNPDAHERFKEVSEAYNVIGSPDSRSDYDHHRSGGNRHHHGSFEDIFSNLGFNPFGDGFFSAHTSPPPHEPPTVTKVALELTIDELRRGGKTVPLRIRVKKVCSPCNGLGGDHSEICHGCAGIGSVHRLHHQGSMIIKTSEPCTLCYGRGKLISRICQRCNGTGSVREIEEYNVEIGVTRK